MRITNRMIVDNAVQNMAGALEKKTKLQNQIATGKQFQTAAENPVNASISLSLRSNLRTVESYVSTTDSTKDWMGASDFAFDKLETLANRANNLVLRGLNDTFTGKDRQSSLGDEMQTLIQEAIDIGNTQHNGQFIFSGYNITTKPFSLSEDTPSEDTPSEDTPNRFTDNFGKTVRHQLVSYIGDTNFMERSLGPDQSVKLNVPGDPSIKQFIASLVQAHESLIKDTSVITDPYDPGPLQNSLTALKSSLDALDQYRTSNGARMRQVESAADFLAQVKIETKSLLSKKEDTNVAEAIASLVNQESTYQAVLEVSQRAISTLSLFDYMQ